MKLSNIANKKHTLKRKLFAYMCVLAISLCVLLLIGLFIIGNFTGTKSRVHETLDFQMQVFSRQIETYYDSLALMSVQLSDSCTDIMESYFEENQISFESLNDSKEHIENLQESLIDTMRHKLWEADCTGIFVMLDAQINSKIENAKTSRTGIYLQRNSLEGSDTRVLLYRGLSKVGKDHNCMPHRKWRLEFNTNLFPNYENLKAQADFPLNQSYRISDVILLPGTDQHVMLMTVPILSKDGEFYGLCGFELNEGYFKQIFAQPSELEHAIFCVSKGNDSFNLTASTTLSAGILNKYYLEPSGNFNMENFGGGLIHYQNEDISYIGVKEEIQLCPSACTCEVNILIPKNDYDRMFYADTLRVVFLIVAFSLVAICLSMFFSRQYLRPLKKALDSIRKKEYTQDSACSSEIEDLFVFLAEQDRINEEELSRLRREKTDAITAASELQSKFDETAKENERLAYSRKNEVDPDDYKQFLLGIQSLTAKERLVFDYYLEGKTVKEIIELVGFKESTIRFHNRNIYSKLGVSSLKQLLRFAAIMKHDEENEEAN